MSTGKAYKNKKAIIRTIISVILISVCFFTIDLIRAKKYNLPPIFCIKTLTCANGNSTHYYGPGYKVWEDYHPIDNDVHYYIGLWVLPDSISI